MAIGFANRFSEQAGAAEYDKVSAVLDVEGSPDADLPLAGEVEGIFQVVGESRGHFDRFREERLVPAMKEAMGEEMVAQMPAADYLEAEIDDYH